MPIRLPASLRGRLALMLTALFAALLAILLLMQAESLRHARDAAQARALDLAQGYARHYERLVRDHLAMLDILLRLRGLGPQDEGCVDALRQVVAATPSLINLAVVDGEGRLRCAARDVVLSGAAKDAARRVLAAGAPMLGMSGGTGQERHYLALARPLAGEGRSPGAILAFIDRDWLNAHFAETVPNGVVLRIFDNDGVFVVRQPDPACCVGKSGLHLGGVGQAIASGREQVTQSLWLDGVTRLQADLPLREPLAGVVSIGIPEELAVTEAERGAAGLAAGGALPGPVCRCLVFLRARHPAAARRARRGRAAPARRRDIPPHPAPRAPGRVRGTGARLQRDGRVAGGAGPPHPCGLRPAAAGGERLRTGRGGHHDHRRRSEHPGGQSELLPDHRLRPRGGRRPQPVHPAVGPP